VASWSVDQGRSVQRDFGRPAIECEVSVKGLAGHLLVIKHETTGSADATILAL